MSRRPALAAPPTADVLARVQAVMDGLRAELAPMLAREAERLHDVRELAARDPAGAREALPPVVHDLKGLGTTCDQPLVSRVAASLEGVLAHDAGWSPAVALHVDGLLTLARGEGRAPDDPAAVRLAETLERLAGG